jgi:glutamate decarboxylase
MFRQMMNLTNTSDWLAEQISDIEDAEGNAKFELLGDNLGGKGLPLVAWHLKKKEDYDGMPDSCETCSSTVDISS